jgi:hypothetical protein
MRHRVDETQRIVVVSLASACDPTSKALEPQADLEDDKVNRHDR